ncbi:MAG: hypothetical protein Q7T16_05195, partial [Candidatus Burarchaeum sp.]
MGKVAMMLLGLLILAGVSFADSKILVIGTTSFNLTDILAGHDVTYVANGADYSTLPLGSYDLVIFNEYHHLTAAEGAAIKAYVDSDRPVITTAGVPLYFLGSGVNVSSWLGATSYGNSGLKATMVEENAFGSGLANNSVVHTNAGTHSGTVSGLKPGAHVVAKWYDGSVFAFYYGKAYYQSETRPDASYNSSRLFRSAVDWLLSAPPTKLPYKVLVLGAAGSMDAVLPEYNITYISGADYSALPLSNYDIVIFTEYKTLTAAEDQAIEGYGLGDKPVLMAGSGPAWGVQAAGCPDGAHSVDLTRGGEI